MERDLEKEYIVEEIIRDDDNITSLYLNQSGEGDERTRGDGSGEGDERTRGDGSGEGDELDHRGDRSGEGEGDDSEGEAHGAEVYIY
jgi:hypothetical protein